MGSLACQSNCNHYSIEIEVQLVLHLPHPLCFTTYVYWSGRQPSYSCIGRSAAWSLLTSSSAVVLFSLGMSPTGPVVGVGAAVVPEVVVLVEELCQTKIPSVVGLISLFLALWKKDKLLCRMLKCTEQGHALCRKGNLFGSLFRTSKCVREGRTLRWLLLLSHLKWGYVWVRLAISQFAKKHLRATPTSIWVLLTHSPGSGTGRRYGLCRQQIRDDYRRDQSCHHYQQGDDEAGPGDIHTGWRPIENIFLPVFGL